MYRPPLSSCTWWLGQRHKTLLASSGPLWGRPSAAWQKFLAVDCGTMSNASCAAGTS